MKLSRSVLLTVIGVSVVGLFFFARLRCFHKQGAETTLETEQLVRPIENAPSNTATIRITTSLVDAASMGDIATMKELIAKGADVNEKSKGFFHWTPLMAAVHTGATNTNAVDFLLQNGADVNAKDTNGETPLIWAARGGDRNVELVKKLIAKGADINARDNNGATALGYAAPVYGTQATNIVKLLKQAGATQ